MSRQARSEGPGPTPPQRPSLASVAARAGVSIATVSRIINGIEAKASPATVRRVRAIVAELGYRPSGAGAALRRRQSRLVAVLAPNMANATMAAMAGSIEAALRAEGLVMVICDTHEDPALQDEYLLEMRAQLVRGIVLLGAVASPALADFRARGEPLVFVNRRAPDGATAPFVGIDNRAAGEAVAALVHARGIEDVAVIHGPLTSSATADRVAGFRARLAAAGLVLPAARVLGPEGADHLRTGQRGMVRLLAQAPPPRAVFCLSDLIAYGAQRACREAGLRVPQDVLLVGFDDNPLNDWLAPWLTTVRVPVAQVGAAVVATLDALARDGRSDGVVLPFEIVER